MCIKNSYFWATPSGPINLIKAEDMPVQPHYGICETEPRPECFNKSNCLCAEKWKPYRESLQRAKESSVPIQNEIVAVSLIAHGQTILDLEKAKAHYCKLGEVYGPFTVEYRIEEVFSHCTVGEKHYVKVAILYDDTPEKEESIIPDVTKVMIDVHIEAMNRGEISEPTHEDSELYQRFANRLLSKFTITRKQ